jgi:two-component system, NtrC family, response regulator AtoC
MDGSSLETIRRGRDADSPAAQYREPRPTSLVGRSPAITEIRQLLEKIAGSPDSTVLLLGESGTGKGLIAREIHRGSKRSQRPFQSIICSALPETLLESELFGHEPGAFTDARQRKRGLLEVARGGTVFLDEIGEISQPLQLKLLQFLEERVFKRLGGTDDIRIDVRVIAATNRDLDRAVGERSFRPDLYYRLAVLPVRMPPLRERRGDVPLLVDHFIALFNAALGKGVRGIASDALERLEDHFWPGNVRELRNVIERAMLLTEGRRLSLCDFPRVAERFAAKPGFELPPEGVDLECLEKDLVRQALARSGGNRTRAARLLGLSRHQLRSRLAKLQADGGDGYGAAGPA